VQTSLPFAAAIALLSPLQGLDDVMAKSMTAGFGETHCG
jgi:hypothetical protein